MNLLTDEFIKKCRGEITPPFTELGEFVFYRTYSRWLEEKGRRETWEETCRRATEYNFSLQYRKYEVDVEELRKEAEDFYKRMYGLKHFLSGRTLWVGGTPVADKYPMANFNCAFIIIDSFEAYRDLFYLLMVGTGVGIRILKADVEKLPQVRMDVELIHLEYRELPKGLRKDYTTVKFIDREAILIEVGDSKEGWVEALHNYFQFISDPLLDRIKRIYIDFSHVRPKGERLKTFGGTASGHESLKRMFEKIDLVIKGKLARNYPKHHGKLRPIHCLDIANIIGENVVVGGVRRTSEIVLLDPKDKECLNAKKQISRKPELFHRFMSNNSVYYTEKPSRERFKEQFRLIKKNGEPCFINAEQGALRREDFEGVNPCGEVLLRNRGLCNLLTANVMGFVYKDYLDIFSLMETIRQLIRAGIRMSLVDLELPKWDKVQKEDRLVGVSLTGWKDAMEVLGYSEEQEIEILSLLKAVARTEAEKFCDRLGINRSILVTTIKPEGTISQLPTVSSGVHYSHAEYYIRRVRINSHDPLCEVAEGLGWSVKAEVGQDWETCNTKVIEFPVKSPSKRTKYEVSAIEQLETYKRFMEYYVEHNCSITVSVKPNEWGKVEKWVWDNWDSVVGITFISLDDNGYELAPYEAITVEEYNKRKADMKEFSPDLLNAVESNRELKELDIGNETCEGGACPLR